MNISALTCSNKGPTRCRSSRDPKISGAQKSGAARVLDTQAAICFLEGFPEGYAELIGKRRIVLDGNVLTNKLLRLFVCRHGNLIPALREPESLDFTPDRFRVVL